MKKQQSPASRFLDAIDETPDKYKEPVLSRKQGILPSNPLPEAFPTTYKEWDEMITQMPNLLKTYRFREVVSKMSVLSACDASLDDRYLPRASIFFSSLAHAYCFSSAGLGTVEADRTLPECIERPWSEVTKRLERSYIGRTYLDEFTYNWRYTGQSQQHTLGNLKPLISYFSSPEEDIQIVTNSAIVDTHFKDAIGAIASAQDAVINKDNTLLEQSLNIIRQSLKGVTKAMKGINPSERSPSFVDPIVWGKTFVSMVASTRPEEPNGTGADTPLFHILDAFIHRSKYDSNLGQQILKRQETLPVIIKDFLEAIRMGPNLQRYIMQLNEKDSCRIAYKKMCDQYETLLNTHRKKAYGFMKLIVSAGRKETNGGTNLQTNEDESRSVSEDLSHDMTESTTERRKSMSVCGYASLFGQTQKCPMRNLISIGKSGKGNEKKLSPHSQRTYSLSEVARHHTFNDAWIIIAGKVYDVSDYNHPGGKKIFRTNYGMDATRAYQLVHKNDASLLRILEKQKRFVGFVEEHSGDDRQAGWKHTLYESLKLKHTLTNNFEFNQYRNRQCSPREDVPFFVIEDFISVFSDSFTNNMKQLAGLWKQTVRGSDTAENPFKKLLDSEVYSKFALLGEKLKEIGKKVIYDAASDSLQISGEEAHNQVKALYNQIVNTVMQPFLEDVIGLLADGVAQFEEEESQSHYTVRQLAQIEQRIDVFIHEMHRYLPEESESNMQYLQKHLNVQQGNMYSWFASGAKKFMSGMSYAYGILSDVADEVIERDLRIS